MYKKDALDYFSIEAEERARLDKDRSVINTAKALAISPAAVSQWGRIVPKGSAETLHRISFQKIPLKFHHYTNN